MKTIDITVDGKRYKVGVDEKDDSTFDISIDGKRYSINASESEESSEENKIQEESDDKIVRSTLPGVVGKILFNNNDSVKAGQTVMTVVAMKMENEIKASMNGKIKKIHIKEGQTVDNGTVLFEIEGE